MREADHIELDDALGFAVFRAHQALRQDMYRAFRAYGFEMTPEQWVVLVRLWERDGRTQGELADSTQRDKPTMSRMMAGLEERGLIARKAHGEDGRSWLVYLTRKGRELESELVPVARALVARALHGVSAADLAVTMRTLKRIAANAGKAG